MHHIVIFQHVSDLIILEPMYKMIMIQRLNYLSIFTWISVSPTLIVIIMLSLCYNGKISDRAKLLYQIWICYMYAWYTYTCVHVWIPS